MLLDVFRFAVFGLFVLSAGVAFGSWAVRTRRINPFSRSGQLVRRLSDPVLDPLETWLLRRGGNPQNAGWWLLGIALGGGIVVISTVQWLAVVLARTASVAAAGPRGILQLVVYYGFQLILLALVVRVIGSWFGLGRFHRWMRPAFTLTDWIVAPLRRVVPPFGMFDFTPIVAWFLLLMLRGIILRLL